MKLIPRSSDISPGIDGICPGPFPRTDLPYLQMQHMVTETVSVCTGLLVRSINYL